MPASMKTAENRAIQKTVHHHHQDAPGAGVPDKNDTVKHIAPR